MRLCMVLEERKTPKDSSCCSFVSKSCAQNVIYMYNNKKECDMNTWKHMILFNKERSFDRESLVAFWAYQQDWNRLKQKKIKKLWRHDQPEVVIFGKNKNRLHSATVVQFPFSQPSHKSFCRNVGWCWGSWPYLPPISSGWVVVGVWTKIIGQLEGTSPKLFPSICLSKLEASHACLYRLQPFLKMGIMVSTLFIFHAKDDRSGVVDS